MPFLTLNSSRILIKYWASLWSFDRASKWLYKFKDFW